MKNSAASVSEAERQFITDQYNGANSTNSKAIRAINIVFGFFILLLIIVFIAARVSLAVAVEGLAIAIGFYIFFAGLMWLVGRSSSSEIKSLVKLTVKGSLTVHAWPGKWGPAVFIRVGNVRMNFYGRALQEVSANLAWQLKPYRKQVCTIEYLQINHLLNFPSKIILADKQIDVISDYETLSRPNFKIIIPF